MVNLLLPIPWWLLGVILIVGVVLFISGNSRQKPSVRNGGIAFVGIAIGLLLVNHFVETDIEKASRQTMEVVKAVEAGDWPKMASLLDPKANLATVVGSIYKNREELVKGAQDASDRYKLKSIIKTSLEARQDQADITVNLDVLTVQESTMDRPVPSSWQFSWAKSEDGWKLYRIECLKIADQNIQQIKQLIGR